MLWTALLTTLLWGAKAYAWSDVNWPYRSHVVLSNSSGLAVTDKVFEILLKNTDFHPDYAFTAAGADVRLYESDDSTVLPFYIDKWDVTTETGRVFVKTSLAASATKTIYFYYGNTSVVTASDPTTTLAELGLRYHTKPGRYLPTGTPTLAQIETEFDTRADGTGYGCGIIPEFNNISNGSVNIGGSNSNIFFRAEHWFYVDTPEVGQWSFEFAGDYGDGGAMFLDDVELHERWGQDLWWGFDWGNVNEIIRSTGVDNKSKKKDKKNPSLTEGWHVLKFFGSEACCDGGTSVRFIKPGSNAWQTWGLVNHAMIRSPSCATDGISTAITPPNLQTSVKTGVDANGNDLLAGETISYTITLTESNGQLAERVSISDDMSAQSIASISNLIAPAGSTALINGSGKAFTVTDITVPANSSVDITFDALVDSATSPSTVISNTAVYDSPGGDTAYATASMIANDLTVAETADVGLAISVDTPTAAPGSIVTYTVTTTNNSAALAYDVLIGSKTGVFTALRLQFDGIELSPFKCISGCPLSGLTIPLAGEEYDDGTDSWTYTLTSEAGGAPAGYDAVVKQWRIPMSGDMNGNATADNEVVIQYQLIIL